MRIIVNLIVSSPHVVKLIRLTIKSLFCTQTILVFISFPRVSKQTKKIRECFGIYLLEMLVDAPDTHVIPLHQLSLTNALFILKNFTLLAMFFVANGVRVRFVEFFLFV